MRRLTAVVLSLILWLAACTRTAPETAILEAFFAHVGATDMTYLVRAMPVVPRNSTDKRLRGYTFQSTPDFTTEAFGNVKVELVASTEFEALFAKGCDSGWAAFHTKYPKANVLLGFSRVVMRENEAALYVESSSGCLAGLGQIYYFQKIDNQWRVKEEVHMWVS